MSSKNNKGNRDVQQKVKVTKEEAKKLKDLSTKRNLSASEYIRQCALNEDTIPVIDKAPVILMHLVGISTLINDLEPLVDNEKDNTVKLIQEEVLSLWQSLS